VLRAVAVLARIFSGRLVDRLTRDSTGIGRPDRASPVFGKHPSLSQATHAVHL